MSESVVPCIHFVGFRGDEYWSAVKVWGRPHFFHRGWDSRAQLEIYETDTVVFARGEWTQPLAKYNFDDSAVM
jgi:hypothetical protein